MVFVKNKTYGNDIIQTNLLSNCVNKTDHGTA